jgi:hypothetical protein
LFHCLLTVCFLCIISFIAILIFIFSFKRLWRFFSVGSLGIRRAFGFLKVKFRKALLPWAFCFGRLFPGCTSSQVKS